MNLNYTATDLEKLVFETVKSELYVDTKIIKEKKSARTEIKVDKAFVNLINTYCEKLEDYTIKDILAASENVFKKENGKFVNFSQAAPTTTFTGIQCFEEFSEFIEDFNLRNNYKLDAKTIQYYKYNAAGEFKNNISDEEYDTNFKAALSKYNRKLALHQDDDGKFTLGRYQFKEADIKNIYSQNLFNANKFNKKKIIDSIRYNGIDKEDALDFIEDMASKMFIPETIKGFKNINYRRLCAYSIMHWMWQVKRNLLDLETENEMFIIFFSKKQGTGKTTFIENLISAIGDNNIASKEPKDLIDSRENLILEKIVLFFDEINQEGVDKCMATIKKNITADKLTTRMLYSNSHSTIKRRFSGIAGANAEINEYFGDDDSGHRRFFEIRLDDDKGRNHIDEMFKLKSNPIFNQLWTMVDENCQEGYINEDCEIWSELQTIQATYKKNNTVNMFFNDNSHTYVSRDVMTLDELKGYAKTNKLDLKRVSKTKLYNEYTTWCKEHNKACFNIDNFERELNTLRSLKYDKVKGEDINTGKKRYTSYFYLIQHNDEILDDEDTEEYKTPQSNAAVDYMNMIPKVSKDENIDELAAQDDWDL